MNEHKKRARSMCRAIRIAWASLKSHLQYTIDADPTDSHTDADIVFHAKAACEYADQISICTKELKHLNVARKQNGEITEKRSGDTSV